MSKTSSAEKTSDDYEKDIKVSEILDGSGTTKKKMATRRAFDNARLRQILMEANRRYVLIDADESETEEFRHNGTVKVLSEEEKKEYKTKKFVAAILEMRKNK
tara:strand:- start:140 stop:448 length:309 start_codon:yes stop_codon:yes gene_type:complete